MKYFVAVTDNRWYEFLAALKPDEVNFWRPSGQDTFRAVPQGSPFLFKLHSPLDFIAGGGFFAKFEQLPLSMAWDVFGEKNGAADAGTLAELVTRHRADKEHDPVIGCVVLAEPFFFERNDWIPVPSDWAPNIVRGKTYGTQDPTGRALWDQVSQRLQASSPESGAQLIREATTDDGNRFGREYMARARLGQGIFRLFDKGYLTVTADLRVDVSASIREEFDNGREYYRLRGNPLVELPDSGRERPAREYIEWHQEKVFRA